MHPGEEEFASQSQGENIAQGTRYPGAKTMLFRADGLGFAPYEIFCFFFLLFFFLAARDSGKWIFSPQAKGSVWC